MTSSISSLTVLDLVPFGYGGNDAKFFALRLSPPDWAGWKPGQFVMVRPEQWEESIPWARPFSICQMTGRDLILFFQVVGRGTERMATLKPGDKIQVVGPLGTHFEVEEETPTLMLAGGVGIAPFVGYALQHPTPWTLHMIFGHRLPLDFYPFESLKDKILAENVPDRKPGDLQNFIQILDENIADYAAKNGLVLACGPMPFLQTVQKLCLKHKAKAQLSLETRMACGVGACLGCVVQPLLDEAGKNRSGQPVAPALQSGQPVSTCTCGPVFWADSVDLNA
ncbi:dihydroorotate dehydrogenase electron transfer subunit [Desulfovibrio sp. OttesenSCG-928-F07]|nr:dihydroorotate dehydrogenase electron transfer subunit [Desulfovibrio sp. OttesenSCG-928-F07]